MALHVPTQFKLDDRDVDGIFVSLSGAGNNYHLMVNHYYWGQLNYSDHFGWHFSSNKFELTHLSEYFGERIAIALESD